MVHVRENPEYCSMTGSKEMNDFNKNLGSETSLSFILLCTMNIQVHVLNLVISLF